MDKGKEIVALKKETSKTFDLGNGRRRLEVDIGAIYSLPRPTKGIHIDPTWVVGASSDDCFRRLTPSVWNLASSNMIIGAFSAVNYQYGAGMRFTNITIPKGAVIDAAYLILQASMYRDGTTVKTRISAEDVDDALTFADNAAAFDARWAGRTTARVNWDNIPTWWPNADYHSPEIKTVIQEIVDRAGWASGNSIVIFWDDFDDRSTHGDACRYAYAYDAVGPSHPGQLHIEYTIPATMPTGTTNPATLVADIEATLNGTVTGDGGEACEVRFQYGLTAAYGTNTAWQPGKVTGDAFSQAISGLTPNTMYHFRAQIRNSAGTANGIDRTFTTEFLPTPFLRRVLRDVFGSGADINAANPLQVYDPATTSIGKLQVAATTIELNQAAGAKDLFVGTTQDVVIEKLVLRMPNVDISGGGLTSISIQTDDAEPQIFVSSTTGALANLTQEAQLAWTGACLIKAGTKIQLTISGAAAGVACVCDVIAQCRAVIAGGNLA